jgi:trimethylamine--corrinoid protein Co-methyltransferase
MSIGETEQIVTGEGRRRRASGGADARRARRQAGGRVQLPFIRRKLANYEVLDEEGLSLIEANTDLIMEEIGLEFREDEEALLLWKEAGADVKGSRVHFPKGLCNLVGLRRRRSPSTRATRNARVGRR